MNPTPLDTGQIILFLTTLGGIAVALYKDHRARAWAVEDRRLALAEAAQQRQADLADVIARAQADAEALRIKSEAIALSLAIETRANSAREAAKIRLAQEDHAVRLETQMQQVSAAAEKAYEVANHVNAKIAAQQDAMIAQTVKRDGQMAALQTQIESVHTAADSAYQEANHVNEKIENLNERLIEQGTTHGDTRKQMSAIAATITHNAGTLGHVDQQLGAVDSKVDRVVDTLTTRPLPLPGGRRVDDPARPVQKAT